MRVLLTVLIAVSSATAFDGVVFSSEQQITKEFPTIENLISTASPEKPVVFIIRLE
ncbi:hypothetical protein COOONC_12259 [Cooperia oncophora]